MKRAVVPLLLTLLFGLTFAIESSACGRDGEGCSVPLPSADGSGVGYTYESQRKLVHPRDFSVTGSESGQRGSKWQTKRVRACDEEGADPGGSSVTGSCMHPICHTGGESAYMTRLLRRESSNDSWSRWPGRGLECTAGTSPAQRPIAIQEFQIEIESIIEQHYSRIARPKIVIQPRHRPLVNLPVLASTPNAGPVGFDISEPLPGRVEAVPTYRWQWSNGTTSTGPGKAYDGTNPVQAGSHYPVQATYTNAGRGSAAITATWSITLTLAGGPTITDIRPLVYDETAGFTVHNARTVLVD